MQTRIIVITVAALLLLPVAAAFAETHEGIQVHGHWTVVVRNPDGTLVSRREFENALTTGALLTAILTKTATLGLWQIQTDSTTGQQICSYSGSRSFCSIVEPSSPNSSTPAIFKNLTLTAVIPPGSPYSVATAVTLSGTVTATFDGTIDLVSTSATLCSPPATPCLSTGSAPTFTQRTLPTAIGVKAGQIVQVSVTFTFS